MQQNSLESSYSMTSSARASSVAGTSRPRVVALWALMTSSNFDVWTTGRSCWPASEWDRLGPFFGLVSWRRLA